MTSFQEKLEEIANDSLYAVGANAATIRYTFEVFKRYFRRGAILELGPAEGVMTDLLMTLDQELHCVDGSGKFCADLSARHPGIQVTHSLFEEFETSQRFENIVLGHVLEHVEDPVQILGRVRNWLADDGIVLTAVPNAYSLHRQAAVLMGLLETEKSMSELDRHHGHYRVFDPFEFRATFGKAGFDIVASGGYWMKPLSNAQIEATWTDEMLQAFMELGERYPDIAGEQYVIAKRSDR
jgi:2-polyprenyl-3-methyl-5-hydroxy-6-metoxy-1,4-benzoquinol methylase